MREFHASGVTFIRMIRRAQGHSPNGFQNAWLGVDVAAIARLPGLVRYGQHHALLRGYDKGELIFDGFEEFTFAQPAALAAALASPAWAALHEAMAAFVDHRSSLTATIDIHLQKRGTPPPDAIRSTEFVNRRPDLSLAAFRDYWIGHHGPLAQHIPQIIRYEQHHLADGEYAGGKYADRSPRFDGWAATWFTGTAAMREAARDPVYLQTRADEANFLAGPLPVLFTRERLALLGN